MNTHPSQTALSIDRVTHHLGTNEQRRVVLFEASLQVRPGEWVAVMGPSGSGKSTLLHMVGGLDTPQSGSIEIGDVEISSLSDSDRARFRCRHIGYVFQNYNLIDDLTVGHNVELPLLLRGMARRRARRLALEMLERLGLTRLSNSWPAQLSGGEQQRVAIARALVGDRVLVLADEPTGALDSAAAMTVMALLRAANAQGQTILMVTHDPVVAEAADRVVWMSDGAIADGLTAAAPSARRTAVASVARGGRS